MGCVFVCLFGIMLAIRGKLTGSWGLVGIVSWTGDGRGGDGTAMRPSALRGQRQWPLASTGIQVGFQRRRVFPHTRHQAGRHAGKKTKGKLFVIAISKYVELVQWKLLPLLALGEVDSSAMTSRENTPGQT